MESRIGTEDKRQRNLFLTDRGHELESKLSAAQQARVRAAYSAAGSEAVMGFRKVLECMIDQNHVAHVEQLREAHSK